VSSLNSAGQSRPIDRSRHDNVGQHQIKLCLASLDNAPRMFATLACQDRVVAELENAPDVLQHPWFVINDKNSPPTSFASYRGNRCHAGWLLSQVRTIWVNCNPAAAGRADKFSIGGIRIFELMFSKPPVSLFGQKVLNIRRYSLTPTNRLALETQTICGAGSADSA
jgi:hypothetical protein